MGEYYYLINDTKREIITDVAKAPHYEDALPWEWVAKTMFWSLEDDAYLCDPYNDIADTYNPNYVAPAPSKDVTNKFHQFIKDSGINMDALNMICPECGVLDLDECTNECEAEFFVPTEASLRRATPTINPELFKENAVKNYKNGQCIATTKKGTQCLSGAMKNEQMCGPHLDQAASMMEEEMEDRFIVAGTGSRSLQIADAATKRAVVAYLIEQFTALKEKYGDRLYIMTGMAEGFDTAMARAAMNCDIPYIAVLPNKGYGRYYWMNKSVTGTNRYREFVDYIANADEVVYVMEDIHKSSSIYLSREGGVSGTVKGIQNVHSNFIRNEVMVERANAFYVYDPESRGTAHCFDLVKKTELPYKLVPMN